jgi:hypothetical protein
MSIFLYHNEEEAHSKINIDDLYENQKKKDLKQLSIFKKILGRIHNKIQAVSRSTKSRPDKHIWYLVPEYILGEPLYDKGDCIAYIIHELEENKFHIRYVHPNTIFISWAHWVPSYVRSEFKRKTGKIVDEFGVIKDAAAGDDAQKDEDAAAAAAAAADAPKQAKKYRPPNFIYGDDILERMENRFA